MPTFYAGVYDCDGHLNLDTRLMASPSGAVALIEEPAVASASLAAGCAECAPACVGTCGCAGSLDLDIRLIVHLGGAIVHLMNQLLTLPEQHNLIPRLLRTPGPTQAAQDHQDLPRLLRTPRTYPGCSGPPGPPVPTHTDQDHQDLSECLPGPTRTYA